MPRGPEAAVRALFFQADGFAVCRALPGGGALRTDSSAEGRGLFSQAGRVLSATAARAEEGGAFSASGGASASAEEGAGAVFGADGVASAGGGRTVRVLGIDPGLASTGFGVVDCCGSRCRMVSYGVIQTPADCPHGERLLAIYDRLDSVVTEFAPQEAGMETLYFARNVTSAMGVAEARGVITLCLTRRRIRLGEYTPNQIKQAVTGTASADKKLVEKYVRLLLNLKSDPKPDHAADALAGAITHIHYSLHF